MDEINENPIQKVTIKISENGPLVVNGNVILIDKSGIETIREGKMALCRCGGSEKKPFCDGTHKRNGFIG
jgi:CDGSH iron-sulfur domain-containing protein 3